MRAGLSRLAPSPSGRIHLGNIFSFLLTWADARSRADKIVFRMDDLDERCQNKEVQQTLIDDLRWLGIEWDGRVVYQSERVDIYQDAFDALSRKNLLYPCFCSRASLHAASAPHASDGTPIYAGTCKELTPEQVRVLSGERNPAWRAMVPDMIFRFTDDVFGAFSQNLKTECGDFIIRRSDGVFAYQLASAVDDAQMGVTRIMRGCDLLASTPRQLWLVGEIGARDKFTACEKDARLEFSQHEIGARDLLTERFAFAHLPMLVNEKGQRLAKRDKSLDLGVMRAQGITASQLRGKVAWLAGFIDEQSELTAEEFVGVYNVYSLKKCGAKIVTAQLSD